MADNNNTNTTTTGVDNTSIQSNTTPKRITNNNTTPTGVDNTTMVPAPATTNNNTKTMYIIHLSHSHPKQTITTHQTITIQPVIKIPMKLL